MFYYVVSAYLKYNLFLIAAAVIPAVFLMIKVYRSDRLEKESPGLLWSLTLAGILSALIALVSERILGSVLGAIVRNKQLYQILLYFVVVACSEEGAKYFLLKRRTWNSWEFNCQYDGVVYAVFVSLGFALWENISYVLHYGFSTALVRAVTAIPGHSCFGVFMGVFYGMARRSENIGQHEAARLYRVLSVLVPVLLHGAYDYIATLGNSTWIFLCFIAAIFVLAYCLVIRMSKADRYISEKRR